MNRTRRHSRVIPLILALLMILSAFAACTAATPTDDTQSDTSAPIVAPTEDNTDNGTADPTTPSETAPVTDPETNAPVVDQTPAGHRPAQEVKIISMNLDANAATATERAKRMLPMLLEFEADSIGVQEARGPWITMLKYYLTKDGTYARVGVDAAGNPDATQGHFATYIFYRADKYDLVASGTFWMSKTPDVPSIYDSTVDCNRTCTWAILENKETGFRYVHMNTHLDWMNMEVNKIQVSMIREQIERFEKMGYPVFATGDYNCDEGTASYQEMLKSDVIADSKFVADRSMDLGTYPSYGEYDVTKTKPIDYVFVTKEHMTVHEYKVIDEKPGGDYVSDHNGLFVHATVKAMPIHENDSESTPAFAEGATVELINPAKDSATLRFPQAMDALGMVAHSYTLKILAADKTIVNTTVYGGLFLPVTPDEVEYNLDGLTNGTVYTVEITPASLPGQKGAPLTVNCTFESNVPDVTPQEMGAADIFDLAIKDGAPVDISPNQHAFKTIGSPAVDEIDGITGLVFQGNGNYKIPTVKDHYTKLADGFTMELYFKTGSDISTYSNPASNFHAGGFGYAVDGGKLRYDVRLNGAYVSVSATIEPNTVYHAVGVYDHENGLLSLYINGELVDSAAGKGMTHPTDNGAKYLCIGADSDAGGNGEYPFKGAVFNVRLYDDAASAGQALWLYEKTAS